MAMSKQDLKAMSRDAKIKRFDELYAQGAGLDSSKAADILIFPIYDEMFDIGFDLNYVYERVVHSRNVGIHRTNRDGAIVSGMESLNIWRLIDSNGVVPDLWQDATAFEEGPERLNEKAFLEKVASDDLLPQSYKPGDIDISAVACSHFGCAVVGALDGREFDIEELTVHGKLSVDKIVLRHPKLKLVFETGLKYKTWKADVEKKYPLLPNMCQRAMNVKHNNQQGQSQVQLLLRASNMVNHPVISNNADIEDRVVVDIMKNDTMISRDEAKSMYQVAKKFGGQGAQHLQDIITFYNAHKVQGRRVSAAHWKSMASQKDANPNMLLTTILVLTCWPVQNALSSSDINFLAKKSELAAEATSILVQAKSLCVDLLVPKNHATKAIGILRMSMLMTICAKLKGKTLQSHAHGFFEIISQHATSDEQMQNPWQSSSQVEEPVVKTDSQSIIEKPSLVVEYGDDGKQLHVERNRALEAGWQVGVHAKHKSSGRIVNKGIVLFLKVYL